MYQLAQRFSMADTSTLSPVTADPLVEFRDVTFSYPGSSDDRVILNKVTFTVPRGKVTALMGASGGGKTTVLRLVGGQQKANSGEVLFDGNNVAQMAPAVLYAARRRMGMLFQFGALFTDLSVFDNVAFPLREHTSLDASLVRDIVLMKLNAVGLRGARHLMPAEVSGGMARRVALARAIVLDPELIMYDEPFAGLDPISMGVIANLIRRLNDALGSTSILVSHDVHESFAIADYIYFLSQGKIVAEGTPAELQASTDPYVEQFINARVDGPVPFHYPGRTLAVDLGLEARP